MEEQPARLACGPRSARAAGWAAAWAAVQILAFNACREQLRSRFYSVTLLFGGLILYLSLLLGMLAADQELRVLTDFGLSFIELLSALAVAFAAATGTLQEMETKTLYLVLTRPVPRWAYLSGRFLGLVASALTSLLLMSAVHVVVLLAKGWAWEWGYLLALAGVACKVVLAAALSALLAMVSTSALSALSMTGILWMLGHFVPELRFLIRRSTAGAGESLLLGAAYLLPNLQLFNFRDRLGVPASSAMQEPVGFALAYAAAYVAACLMLTQVVFKRKEF